MSTSRKRRRVVWRKKIRLETSMSACDRAADWGHETADDVPLPIPCALEGVKWAGRAILWDDGRDLCTAAAVSGDRDHGELHRAR